MKLFNQAFIFHWFPSVIYLVQYSYLISFYIFHILFLIHSPTYLSYFIPVGVVVSRVLFSTSYRLVLSRVSLFFNLEPLNSQWFLPPLFCVGQLLSFVRLILKFGVSQSLRRSVNNSITFPVPSPGLLYSSYITWVSIFCLDITWLLIYPLVINRSLGLLECHSYICLVLF